MIIKFLGTNGWYATETGNTICTLIEAPDRYIVLDAGDGFARLDLHLKDPEKPLDIFLSHLHLDHIIGLHTLPKFSVKNGIRIFGARDIQDNINDILRHPFTAPIDQLRSKTELVCLKEGLNKISGYDVEMLKLVHADPCFGYRINIDGRSIAYCTDTGPCENIVHLAKDASVLIAESALLPGMPLSEIWPHLTPEISAELAKRSGCKKLILTHFDAMFYDTIEKRKLAKDAARKIFQGTIAAEDMMEISV